MQAWSLNAVAWPNQCLTYNRLHSISKNSNYLSPWACQTGKVTVHTKCSLPINIKSWKCYSSFLPHITDEWEGSDRKWGWEGDNWWVWRLTFCPWAGQGCVLRCSVKHQDTHFRQLSTHPPRLSKQRQISQLLWGKDEIWYGNNWFEYFLCVGMRGC